MLFIDKEALQIIEALWIGVIRNGVEDDEDFLFGEVPFFRGATTKEIASRCGLPIARVRDLLAKLHNRESPYYYEVVFGEGSTLDSWTIHDDGLVYEELLDILGLQFSENEADGAAPFSWTVPPELTDDQIRKALSQVHASFENMEANLRV
jgi:hypothetical protein